MNTKLKPLRIMSKTTTCALQPSSPKLVSITVIVTNEDYSRYKIIAYFHQLIHSPLRIKYVGNVLVQFVWKATEVENLRMVSAFLAHLSQYRPSLAFLFPRSFLQLHILVPLSSSQVFSVWCGTLIICLLTPSVFFKFDKVGYIFIDIYHWLSLRG